MPRTTFEATAETVKGAPSQEWRDLHAYVMGRERASSEAFPDEEFADRLRAAVQHAPWSTGTLNDLGNHFFHEGAFVHASACYALAAENASATGSRVNLGRCEVRLGRPAIAEARARKLLENEPRLAAAWQLLSEALLAQQRTVEARQAARRAAEVERHSAMLFRRWAALCELTGDIEGSVQAYRRAWLCDPSDIRSLRMLIFNMRTVCRWQGLPGLNARLMQALAEGNHEVAPFDLLVEPSTAAQQLECARAMARHLAHVAGQMPIQARGVSTIPSRRTRVGFVSHGFGLHPTTILSLPLFERLRAFDLEIHLFSTRSDKGHVLRDRLGAAVHALHDVSGWPARRIACHIRELGVDVLVDMDGYGRMHGPDVFAYRPSSLQVGWLAYPGTTGAAFMDYIVADRFVLPGWLQPCFTEKVAYLPRCYQCIDSTRAVVPPPSREACGLPAKGVVYACFNASYKLDPHSVTRMLRVLAAVPDSVVWLLKGPGHAAARLRALAGRMGVAPSRLVFMDKMAHGEYLSRYRHADLFLDTDGYNAHTVASDAMWAGCPVLTRPGGTFAGRVAGSLNHYLGMPEMNVADDDAFVALAVRHGLDEDYRSTIRSKLQRQKEISGLFDIQGYARDFAALLMRMAAHHRAGGIPAAFTNEVD